MIVFKGKLHIFIKLFINIFSCLELWFVEIYTKIGFYTNIKLLLRSIAFSDFGFFWCVLSNKPSSWQEFCLTEFQRTLTEHDHRIFCHTRFNIQIHRNRVSEFERDRAKGDPELVFVPLLVSRMSWMCWTISFIATVFSTPRGMMTSANFLVGMQNSSNAGLTNVMYWCRTWSMFLPRSCMSRRTRRAKRVSASVSTKSFMWNMSRTPG